MGRGIRLSDSEFDQIDLIRLKAPDADTYRNCLILIMSDLGDTLGQIAQRLGCSKETVVRIRKLYRQTGIAALTPGRSPGRPSQANAEFLQALKTAVATCPLELGYGFSTWSAARLAAHLAKLTGISFSDDQIRRLLKQQGYSLQRPKHTMAGKRNQADYQTAQKQLRRLKKKP
jgi:transposase